MSNGYFRHTVASAGHRRAASPFLGSSHHFDDDFDDSGYRATRSGGLPTRSTSYHRRGGFQSGSRYGVTSSAEYGNGGGGGVRKIASYRTESGYPGSASSSGNFDEMTGERISRSRHRSSSGRNSTLCHCVTGDMPQSMMRSSYIRPTVSSMSHSRSPSPAAMLDHDDLDDLYDNRESRPVSSRSRSVSSSVVRKSATSLNRSPTPLGFKGDRQYNSYVKYINRVKKPSYSFYRYKEFLPESFLKGTSDKFNFDLNNKRLKKAHAANLYGYFLTNQFNSHLRDTHHNIGTPAYVPERDFWGIARGKSMDNLHRDSFDTNVWQRPSY